MPRVRQVSQQLALGLTLVGVALAAALLFSLSLRSARSGESASSAPFAAGRRELDTLTKLAENSAAQSAELSQERDVRRRAEEDAVLKQRLLAQSLEERVRLGRDLHDGIIQSLYAAGLTLESARDLIARDPAEAERRIEQSRIALNTTIREVRGFIGGLAPENLRSTTFTQAAESLLQELRAGRDVTLDAKIDRDASGLLTEAQTVEALQIAREAFSNALRHGGASLITLRMHRSDREICLLVQDNGTGFDPGRRREGGHGLGNIHARAHHLGAQAVVTSRPGEGTRVVVTLPIASAAASP